MNTRAGNLGFGAVRCVVRRQGWFCPQQSVVRVQSLRAPRSGSREGAGPPPLPSSRRAAGRRRSRTQAEIGMPAIGAALLNAAFSEVATRMLNGIVFLSLTFIVIIVTREALLSTGFPLTVTQS